MAERDEKVMAMVVAALKKSPDLTSRELHERATKLNKGIGDLSVRQFHAQYAIQAKKRLRGGKPASKKAGKAKGRKVRGGRGAAASRRPAQSVPGFLQRQLDERLESLTDAIRRDFASILSQDSLQAAGLFLLRVEKLQKRWKGTR